MNHHCSSFGYNYPNAIFSNTVLPFGADTAESNVLVLLVELSRKGLALEDADYRCRLQIYKQFLQLSLSYGLVV